MWLLVVYAEDFNNEKIELVQFTGRYVPPYAILSHRWQDDEVLFPDIARGTSNSRQGYAKLSCAMTQARKDEHGYLWIGTCCINKDSSAELQEAINAMYGLYERADVCYAYLADVDSSRHPWEPASLKKSDWFTRGWTLQELIAPSAVYFFDSDWKRIGSKDELKTELSDITGIDEDILIHSLPPSSVCIAKRMSWAAKRQATREEDMAYCLMGLFDVNMPMLYGEGNKAFLRLQEEIMRRSDDHTLFAWKDPYCDEPHGLLADRPAAFRELGNCVPYPEIEERLPHEMTNRGLRIQLHVASSHVRKQHLAEKDYAGNAFSATLHCHREGQHGFVAVFLEKVAANRFTRVNCGELYTGERLGVPLTLYVPQHFQPEQGTLQFPYSFVKINSIDTKGCSLLTLDYEVSGDGDVKDDPYHDHEARVRGMLQGKGGLMFKTVQQGGQRSVTVYAEVKSSRTGVREDIEIDLGLGSKLEFAFDARISTDSPSPAPFVPRPPNEYVVAGSFTVKVDVSARVVKHIKTYSTSILLTGRVRSAADPMQAQKTGTPDRTVLNWLTRSNKT